MLHRRATTALSAWHRPLLG